VSKDKKKRKELDHEAAAGSETDQIPKKKKKK
jgi:hypothetical protein